MTSGIRDIVITKATPSDIDDIKKIADAHRHELGFVLKPALLEAISRFELLVAKKNDHIMGFVEYRHRRDKQTTLYNIVVMPDYRRLGLGRKLVQELIQEAQARDKQYILLKCPEDLTANSFYEALGFQLRKIEPGKERRLNIWRWML